MVSDAYCAWAATFEWLSDVETDELEPWKRTIAVVTQFGLMTMGDGAGSLFYNHPERVEQVAECLGAIGEESLASQVRGINQLLRPVWEAQPNDLQGALIEAVLSGTASAACNTLDAEFSEKWQPIQERLQALARENGWSD